MLLYRHYTFVTKPPLYLCYYTSYIPLLIYLHYTFVSIPPSYLCRHTLNGVPHTFVAMLSCSWSLPFMLYYFLKLWRCKSYLQSLKALPTHSPTQWHSLTHRDCCLVKLSHLKIRFMIVVQTSPAVIGVIIWYWQAFNDSKNT